LQDNEKGLFASLVESVRQSIRLFAWKNSVHSGRIFMNFILQDFENLFTNSNMNEF